MTREQLKAKYPHCSESFLRRNAAAECVEVVAAASLVPQAEHSVAAIKPYEANRVSSGSKPKRTVRNVALAKASREKANPGRRKVCVVSYRKRLIDPDNLCPKYFIDALRYSGVLADDTVKHIVLEVMQEKSDDPRTEITIE